MYERTAVEEARYLSRHCRARIRKHNVRCWLLYMNVLCAESYAAPRSPATDVEVRIVV